MGARITWGDRNDGPSLEDGFRIYRSDAPISASALPVAIAILGPNARAFDDFTTPTGFQYYAVGVYSGAFERVVTLPPFEVDAGVPPPTPPPPIIPHRYWRLRFTEIHGDNTGFVALSEIELHDTIGGPDLTTPALAASRATSSSDYDSRGPANLFDDVALDGTIWLSGVSVYSGTGQWISWDFGAGNEKAINEVVIRVIGGQLSLSPKHIIVEYSDDNSAWSEEWDIPGSPFPSANEEITFTPAIGPAFRFWRLRFTENHGDPTNDVSMSEVQFRTVSGGVDETSPALAAVSATASSYYGASPPVNAFDDSHSSGTWFTTQDDVYTGSGEWLQWDFGAGNELEITEVAIRAIHTQLGLSVKAFTVEGSSDGYSWAGVWSESAIPYPSVNELKIFTKP